MCPSKAITCFNIWFFARIFCRYACNEYLLWLAFLRSLNELTKGKILNCTSETDTREPFNRITDSDSLKMKNLFREKKNFNVFTRTIKIKQTRNNMNLLNLYIRCSLTNTVRWSATACCGWVYSKNWMKLRGREREGKLLVIVMKIVTQRFSIKTYISLQITAKPKRI